MTTTLTELIDATPLAYMACFAAILISSATHRVTGQAFGLICAPLIALAAPSHVPALILLCGLPVMIYSFKGDWGDIRWREISYAFLGRVVGATVQCWTVESFRSPIDCSCLDRCRPGHPVSALVAAFFRTESIRRKLRLDGRLCFGPPAQFWTRGSGLRPKHRLDRKLYSQAGEHLHRIPQLRISVTGEHFVHIFSV